MVRFLLLTSALIGASAYHAVVPQRSAAAVQSRRAATSDVRMINLFGNNGTCAFHRHLFLGNPCRVPWTLGATPCCRHVNA